MWRFLQIPWLGIGINLFTFACHLEVSAVSPDTDSNKPVTLHGQYPGPQPSAVTQNEVDQLGQASSQKLEPSERLNLFSITERA